jgi:uncharacterized protein
MNRNSKDSAGVISSAERSHGRESVTVQFFNSARKVPAEAWELLPEQSVEGRWWYEALEASNLRSQFKFWYAVLRMNGEAQVLAPLFLMKVPISVILPDWVESFVNPVASLMPQVFSVRSLFVGSPCAEEGTIGVKSHAELAPLMIHLNLALRKFARVNGADMVIWKDFQEHLEELRSLCEEQRYFAIASFPGSSKRIDAGIKNFDDYLAILDSARRKRLRKKLSVSHQQGDLIVDLIQNPDAKLLDQLFALFNQTYQRGKTKFERLDISFFREVGKATPAWWVVLRDPNTFEPVAFNLCFRVGSTIIQKFMGLNYSLGKDWFLYFRLWESSMSWALTQGVTEIQCGQTGYSAKLEVGYNLFPLTNFCWHANPLINKVCSSLAENITWSTLDNDLAVYVAAHPEMLAPSRTGV